MWDYLSMAADGMDNSKELARLLRKAQNIRLAKTQPPLWIAYRFEDEEIPQPPDGIELFMPTMCITIEGSRPADNKGKPYGQLSPQH